MINKINIDDVLVFAQRFEEQATDDSKVGLEIVDRPYETIYDSEKDIDLSRSDQAEVKDKSKGHKWKKMPKGWQSKSRKSYHDSIGGFDGCMKKMKKEMDDPGAFCASLKDRVKGKDWRKKRRKKKNK